MKLILIAIHKNVSSVRIDAKVVTLIVNVHNVSKDINSLDLLVIVQMAILKILIRSAQVI